LSVRQVPAQKVPLLAGDPHHCSIIIGRAATVAVENPEEVP
jgi:hypothetical protein